MKVNLEFAILLGQGNERCCYIHPDDETKCIKINVKKDDPHHTPEQSLVEADYYQYLKNKGVSLDYLPDCHGWVDTSFGKGLVFDRVISKTHGKSITLAAALNKNILNKQQAQGMLDKLHQYLKRNNIMLSDINSDNICVSLGENKLYLVDGLGSRNYDTKYRLKKTFPLLARLKTVRQWRRYHHKLFL